MTAPCEPGAPDLSLVIPLFNEEENLDELAREIDSVLAGTARSYEVIFVDDGSTDGSFERLCRLRDGNPRRRVLRLRGNSGQSAALAVGFEAARAPVVVTLDADLQNDPADIPRLLDELEAGDGCDLVSGIRVERHDSWLRKVSSRVANRVRGWVIHDGISDVGCSLKVYRREFLHRVPVFNGMHRFLPALVRFQGARIREIPVRHRPRLHGTSKYGLHNRLWRGIADLVGVRWLRARWIDDPGVDEVGSVSSTATAPGIKTSSKSEGRMSSCSIRTR